MRVTKGAFSVRAIAGSHAILFGFDCTRDAARGLLGFALGRRQPDGKVRWLRGFKFFAETMPDPQPGERRPTREANLKAWTRSLSSLGPISSNIW